MSQQPIVSGSSADQGDGVGDQAYWLKRMGQNLEMTAAQVQKANSLVVQANDAIQLNMSRLTKSIARSEAVVNQGTFESDNDKAIALENVYHLHQQMKLLSTAAVKLGEATGVMQQKNISLTGPFAHKQFIYSTDVPPVPESPVSPELPKWDPDDEMSWIPYGWKAYSAEEWKNYTKEATKPENGLEALDLEAWAAWDPDDESTWVPFGWKIKNAKAWSEFSKTHPKTNGPLVRSEA